MAAPQTRVTAPYGRTWPAAEVGAFRASVDAQRLLLAPRLHAAVRGLPASGRAAHVRGGALPEHVECLQGVPLRFAT